MAAKTGALWQPRANNPSYRIRGLTLPALASTGPLRLEPKTTLLPDQTGPIRINKGGEERNMEAVAGQAFGIEGGIDVEIMNTTDQELNLTLVELK